LFFANCVCVSTLRCVALSAIRTAVFWLWSTKLAVDTASTGFFRRIFLYCLHGRHHACSYDAAWEFHRPRTSFAGIPDYHRTKLVMM
jgi:hypothetical protein